MVNRENLVQKNRALYIQFLVTYRFNYTYIFTNVFNGKCTLKGADKDQSNLLVEVMNFKKKTRPRNSKIQQ